VPLFLVIGNHDGELLSPSNNRKNVEDLSEWSVAQRQKYFSNPLPDGFYSGNSTPRQNYYAWTWGDALFVVLDPYWQSLPTRSGQDPWNMTLGNQQYRWLTDTLRNSPAKYKLVFIHQLVGGEGESGRGGLEAARWFEWGGANADNTSGFLANRPDWEQPIANLLADTGVDIVFHGHDHFYAWQPSDSVSYQLVPQPAHRNARQHHAEEYGYLEGEFLANSGHLNVSVDPEQLTVRYIRASHPVLGKHETENNAVVTEYTISP
jgi:phosphodiesterase/alkaline phosphatase D-like protein